MHNGARDGCRIRGVTSGGANERLGHCPLWVNVGGGQGLKACKRSTAHDVRHDRRLPDVFPGAQPRDPAVKPRCVMSTLLLPLTTLFVTLSAVVWVQALLHMFN
jgi:hypothetical protein